MIPRRNRGNPDDQVFIFIEYILANLRHAFRDCNGSQAAALAERDASDADQSFRKLHGRKLGVPVKSRFADAFHASRDGDGKKMSAGKRRFPDRCDTVRNHDLTESFVGRESLIRDHFHIVRYGISISLQRSRITDQPVIRPAEQHAVPELQIRMVGRKAENGQVAAAGKRVSADVLQTVRKADRFQAGTAAESTLSKRSKPFRKLQRRKRPAAGKGTIGNPGYTFSDCQGIQRFAAVKCRVPNRLDMIRDDDMMIIILENTD